MLAMELRFGGSQVQHPLPALLAMSSPPLLLLRSCLQRAAVRLTTQSSSPRSTKSFMESGVRMEMLLSPAAAQQHTLLSANTVLLAGAAIHHRCNAHWVATTCSLGTQAMISGSAPRPVDI